MKQVYRKGGVTVEWRDGLPVYVRPVVIDRIVTTGGREYDEHPAHAVTTIIRRQLEILVDDHGLTRVAHGAARRGADRIVDIVASQLVVAGRLQQVQPYPVSDAEWSASGGAGHARNEVMLETEIPPLVLAHPDPRSRGTWHCIVAALLRGITVSVLVPWPKPPGGRVGLARAIVEGVARYATDLRLDAFFSGQQVTLCRIGDDDTIARAVCTTLALALTGGRAQGEERR